MCFSSIRERASQHSLWGNAPYQENMRETRQESAIMGGDINSGCGTGLHKIYLQYIYVYILKRIIHEQAMVEIPAYDAKRSSAQMSFTSSKLFTCSS